MNIGSLFSGYGGLDAGVQAVIGGEVQWHVEWDKAPSNILAHHFPDLPNYGDVSAVDWSSVPPVDVLTGGFPCQDVSLAGRRAGMKDGTRSGLWSQFARAIDELNPGLVVIENVRGLLSAEADRNMEPDPWVVGDGDPRPALRALGAVLGDLADIGYDAEWCGVRAADAGAPHGRFRVFVVAHPRDTANLGHEWAGLSRRRRDGLANAGEPAADTCCDRRSGNAERDGESERSELEASRGPHPDGRSAADPEGRRRGVRVGLDVGAPSGEVNTPRDDRTPTGGASRASTDWGGYEPAIRRWEHMTGRVAPSPTEADGRKGQHRLSARLVEWMMGLPDGWVTSPEIGLTRNEQLKALGNGVVPQQAALALRMLLERAA